MRRIVAVAAMALMAAPVAAETPAEVAQRYGLAGELLVAKGGKVLLDRGFGTVAPDGKDGHRAGETWRLASITKQVAAAGIVRRLYARDASLRVLDEPIEPAWGRPFLGGLTPRQLLTHHTGLANPDETLADAAGVPAFYLAAAPDLKYCASRQGTPGAAFAYNNCDYLVAWALQAASPSRATPSWPAGMRLAKSGETGMPGFVGGRPEPAFDLAAYGAAGGLLGTLRAVFRFDRGLMTGKALPEMARAQLWKPEGEGSYQALGQWVFSGQLAGCAKPKRIVQRDGEILGVQARNFILPDDDMVVIVFTNRSADDFPLGEVWQQSGFVYDLLGAAACP